MMTFAGRYFTFELQLVFCVYTYYCAFKPICGLGLVNSVLFPSLFGGPCEQRCVCLCSASDTDTRGSSEPASVNIDLLYARVRRNF